MSEGRGATGAGGESASAIPWREWGAAAFGEAAEGARPVFLSLQTRWCAWCRRLEEETFADAAVARLLSEEVVPVRVDAERLPHVRDRYIGPGWPTNAFLTPSGGVLWSGPYVDAGELLSAGRGVLSAWRERGAELEAELERRRAAVASARDRRSGGGMPRREAADDVLTFLQQAFDPRNGGFGDAPKYPPVDAVRYLYREAERLGADELADMADRTLDGMLAGEMRDPDTGAFNRYAMESDWTRPSTERLLAVNAELVRAYANAAAIRGREDWAEAAAAAVRWAHDALGRDDGLLAASVPAGEPGRDADPGSGGASGARARPRDDTAFADANAAWARALAEAGLRLGREDWIDRAADLLRLVRERFDDGSAPLPRHFIDGAAPAPSGLLADAVEILAAAIAVASAGGAASALEYAVDLSRRMRSELWTDGDAFLDRSGSATGPLGPAERPFHENAAAAGALLRLDALAEAGGVRSQAERILAFLSPVASRYGIDAAAFALAAEEFFAPGPLVVVRDGPADPDSASLLGTAAARADAGIWRLREDARVAGRDFEGEGPAAAWVLVSGDWAGPARTPEELSALLMG